MCDKKVLCSFVPPPSHQILATPLSMFIVLVWFGRIQFNSEEQWTKALKFMLTNLKWGLAWVSSQFANK